MIRLRLGWLITLLVVVALVGGVAGGTVASHLVQPPAYAAAPRVVVAPPQQGVRSPFVAAIAAVRPAVVNISTVRTVPNPFGPDAFPFPFPFGDIPGIPSGPIYEKGIGSGVIVSADGYILTNAHVVEGAKRLTVTLLDGRTFTGQVVGADPVTDVAVVKIPAAHLPVAQLGSSASVEPGDWAIAIGNPYGLNFTVTVGVISATGRSLPDNPQDPVAFLQTDAAINPGNSGGPLVNTAGQVIGINTAKFANAEGIGFAIPIDTARQIMQQLIATGHVVRPYLGVYVQAVTPALAQGLHLPPGTKGAVVADVAPNSPAAAAGLERGDVILQVNGHRVTDPLGLIAQVRRAKVGSTLVLLVLRNGHTRYITVTVSQMPSGQ